MIGIAVSTTVFLFSASTENRDSTLDRTPAERQAEAEYRALAKEGNSNYEFGFIFACVGVPSFALLGPFALIPFSMGINEMGKGADKVETAAQRLNPNFLEPDKTGWPIYDQSWKLIGWGLPIAFVGAVFTAVFGLGGEHSPGYSAEIAMIGGMGMLATGLIEQGYCWHRFYKRRHNANLAIPLITSLQVQPTLNLTGENLDGAGVNFAAGF